MGNIAGSTLRNVWQLMPLLIKWFKSTALVAIQRVGVQGMTALAQLAIIPLLSPTQLGEFIVFTVVGQVLSAPMHLGLPYSITKQLSAFPDSNSTRTAVLSQHCKLLMASSVLLLIIILLISYFFYTLSFKSYSYVFDYMTINMIILSTALCVSSETLALQTFLAINRAGLGSFLAGGPRSASFLALLAVSTTYSANDPKNIISFYVASCLFASAVSALAVGQLFFQSKAKISKEPEVSPINFTHASNREILKTSSSIMVTILITQMRIAAEPILARVFFGAATAGHIGAARRIVQIIVTGTQTLATLLGPYSVRYNDPEHNADLEKVFGLVAMISVAIAIILSMVALLGGAPLIELFFGTDYQPSYTFLLIMLVMLAMRSFFGFPIQLLFYRDKENIVLLSYLFELTASCFIFLVAWFVSDPVVAVLGVGLTQLCQFCWLWYVTRKGTGIRVDSFTLVPVARDLMARFFQSR